MRNRIRTALVAAASGMAGAADPTLERMCHEAFRLEVR